MFFEFRQNNSGGVFDYNEEEGISVSVIIEADDVDQANYRAERIGLYFDGYQDCECCGDRWYRKGSRDKGDPVPSIYGTPFDPFEYNEPGDEHWTTEGNSYGYIHYKNGDVIAFDCPKELH